MRLQTIYKLIIRLFFCMTLFPVFSQMGLAQQNRAMAGKREVTDRSSSEAEQLIYNFGRQLSAIGKLQTHIYITYSDQNQALPSGEILISVKTLNALLAKPKEFMELCIAFLLSHEFAHQLQYDRYRQDLTIARSCAKRMLYETQADILSGYYVSGLCNFNKKQKRPDPNFVEVMKSILTYIYDLGNAEFALGTHPAHTQRRNAFIIGMYYTFPDGDITEDAKRYIQQFTSYDPKEDLMTWSMKMAKRISHYPNNALSAVVVRSGYEPYKWDTTTTHPLVNYDYTYKNISDKEVRVFIRYMVNGITRTDPDPRAFHTIGDFKDYNFTLKPGDTMLVKDQLNWLTTSTKENMPMVIFPPENIALYNAEFVDEGANVDDDFCPAMNYQVANAGKALIDPTSVRLALQQLDVKAIKDFDAVRTSFATQFRTADLMATYQLNFTVPGAISSNITKFFNKNDTTSLASVRFYQGADSLAAKKVFLSLLKTVADMEKKGEITIDREEYEKISRMSYQQQDSADWAYHTRIEDDVVTAEYKDDDFFKRVKAVFNSTGNELELYYDHREIYAGTAASDMVTINISKKKFRKLPKKKD